MVNDKPFCKTAVSKKCVRRVDLHVLQNMSSGHCLLSAFCFLYFFCGLCLVFVMLSRLSIAALWLPAGKGLTTWLLFTMSNCDFVHFPMWYHGSGVVLNIDCIDS